MQCFGFPRVKNMTHGAGIKIEYLNSVQQWSKITKTEPVNN